jgi:type II secretory pathway component PulF
MVSQLTTLGEESGNLDSVLNEITRFYDTEVENLTKNLASLIEPIMLIVMGLAVAFVVASVLGPIYKLVSDFQ